MEVNRKFKAQKKREIELTIKNVWVKRKGVHRIIG